MPAELIAIGLSHHNANVEIRERVALSDTEARTLLRGLKKDVVLEALVISTCNRTELYALPADPAVTAEYLVDFLLSTKSLPAEEHQRIRPMFSSVTHCEAVTHLFDVIAGIDSQVIGDQQIFAQVKSAFTMSQETGANGSYMTKLAHAAFHVAKRVRSETTIATGAATISYAAVEFCRKIYDDLRGRSALVIGAGETAELAARHLIERGIGTLRIANRNLDHGNAMLGRVREGIPSLDDEVFPLDDMTRALPLSDIIISSTAADGYILSAAQVEQSLRSRVSSNPIVIVDIAVPRDIDPEVGKLPNVFLKDIDDLRSIVDLNLERRKSELPKARAIILHELNNFLALQSKLEAGPTIKELRDRFEQIRLEELERNRAKLSPVEMELVNTMTIRMMNRLLHTPTVMLKEPRASMDDLLSRIELLRELFALDVHNSASSTDEHSEGS
jgi:glutamyl-tRNA reductase